MAAVQALTAVSDRRPRLVRDLPISGRPVLLVWHKRVWRCPEPDCGQRTWSEHTPAIRPKAVLTERARAEVCRRVGQDAHSVAQVAAVLGVGWGTVMCAARHYGQRILDQQWLHTAVVKLGVDETAFLAATATSHTPFVTGLVDLAPAAGGPARLLDVVEGRSGKVVTDWLQTRGTDWCAEVAVAALDPFRGYETALRAGLPGATVVLDAFHAVKLAQTAVDTVRRRMQQEQLGHRGRRDDPLYRIRRVLLRGAENLTEKAYTRLLAGLDAGDPNGQVAAAWIAAHELRHTYGARDLARSPGQRLPTQGRRPHRRSNVYELTPPGRHPVLKSIPQQRLQEPRALGLLRGEALLQLIADGHQLVHLGNYAVLLRK